MLKILVALGEFLPLLVLGGEGLHDALTQQAVLDGGVQLTDLDLSLIHIWELTGEDRT